MIDRDQLLDGVKVALQKAFRNRLRGVVLYGSEARHQATPDSDLDLLVLLDGPINEPSDSWTCIDTLYPLVLESGRPIHAVPIDAEEYSKAEFPLFKHAAREGVLL